MRITAIHNVVERTYAPYTGASTSYVLPGGQELEVEGMLFGEPLEGNNLWYVKDQYKFYWSGGFSFAPKLEELFTLVFLR